MKVIEDPVGNRVPTLQGHVTVPHLGLRLRGTWVNASTCSRDLTLSHVKMCGLSACRGQVQLQKGE